MDTFLPQQRWTSEGEPELGVGVITETGFGRVKIEFPAAGETRMYAEDNAPLRRVLFKEGDTIVDSDQRPMKVEQIQENAGFMIYFGAEGVISEADLGDVTVQHGVDDRLAMGDVDSPALFALRRRTLEQDHQRRNSSTTGFVGGRIDLVPHQLYIANEVSSRYAPRVLLSDEVGLGKTIEACLIIHRLLLSGRISRVLIMVPDSLVHQWFVEVLRRFNLWFHIFDEERCASLDESAPDGNPFLDDQLVICSTSFLAGSQKRASQALSADWDMLVVDEAHHLEWSVEESSPEYSVVELLSRVAKGLLLLTATPEQLGLESHFARLRLLDPERYSDYEVFKNESIDHKNVADVVEALDSGKKLGPKESKLIELLFGEERLAELTTGGVDERENLIEDLLDQHGPGRVLFRNTRSAMSGFPKREAHLHTIEAKEGKELWLERLSNEFLSDLNTSEKQRFWFKEDPRVDHLLALMEKLSPQKVLLICRTKEKVLALEKAMSERASFKVGVFHESLTIVQRDRNAAWFAEADGARLLICSEIGSEGRNFQFAHHLVLFDLPFHPELLEQRIGRLDRIGQTEDIQIHVPYIVGSAQEVLVKWFHEGLNAFQENLEGGNKISSLFGDRVMETVASPDKLKSLIKDTKAFQQELKETLANGRDRLLEMNSFRPKVAQGIVDDIREQDQDLSLEIYMTRVFEEFSIEIEDLAARTYLLRPTRTNDIAFPSIPDDGISVTFDRKRALSREDVSFISWDHPMVTGAIDMVLSSGAGGASFAVYRGARNPGVLMELQFVLETAGGKGVNVDRFLPNTPLRIVVDHGGNDVTDEYPVETFDQNLIPGQIDKMLENETIMEAVLPNMMEAANEFAQELADSVIERGLKRMNGTLNFEVRRLKNLQEKNNNIRPEEIEIALNEQSTLSELIKNARVRLDSLMLVRMGEDMF